MLFLKKTQKNNKKKNMENLNPRVRISRKLGDSFIFKNSSIKIGISKQWTIDIKLPILIFMIKNLNLNKIDKANRKRNYTIRCRKNIERETFKLCFMREKIVFEIA